MVEFNAQIFGDNIKKFRKRKELSQENLAYRLGKSKATISRFESGELIPDAKDIFIICNELGISESDLFERKFGSNNKENIKSPFDTDTLYVYFYAYIPEKKKFEKDKFILNIRQKIDCCEVDFINYHTKKIYSTGYLLADNDVAFLTMENSKPNRKRLDVCEMVINVMEGTDSFMLGAYCGSNQQHDVSLRKCLFSKYDTEFTDEMLDRLKTRDYEMERLKESYALYLDIFNN